MIFGSDQWESAPSNEQPISEFDGAGRGTLLRKNDPWNNKISLWLRAQYMYERPIFYVEYSYICTSIYMYICTAYYICMYTSIQTFKLLIPVHAPRNTDRDRTISKTAVVCFQLCLFLILIKIFYTDPATCTQMELQRSLGKCCNSWEGFSAPSTSKISIGGQSYFVH